MLVSIILLWWLAFAGPDLPEPPRKLALIIAIGDYPPMGGWTKLSSANDAKLLQSALEAQGFSEIVVLADKEATRGGIGQAFDQLTAKARPGDIVFVHYSGHGQQVWDHDSDRFPERRRDEPDGFDEALIPYDAPDEYRPGYYEGENHLVDDEMNVILTGLRRKLGPTGQLILSVDACYSGTISRGAPGLVAVRGTEKKFGPEASTATGTTAPEGSGFSDSFDLPAGQALADMVVMTAARADQPNYEAVDDQGQGVGSLTLALSRNLVRPFPEAPSYEGFFRYVAAEMAQLAPRQQPQIEGNIEKAVFGNTIVPAAGYPVLSFSDNRHLTVRGGQLAGLYPGTIVRLLPVIDDPTQEPLSGKVVETAINSSKVELEQAVNETNPAAWQAQVDVRNLVFQPLHITLNLSDAKLETLLSTRIQETERLTLVDENAQLAVRDDGNALLLSDFHGAELGRYSLAEGTEKAIDDLFQRVYQHTRAEYFRQLGEGAAPELELSVVPVELEQKGNRFEVKNRQEDQLKANSDVQTLALGTPFVFKVTNKSNQPLFLTILGIDANDEIDLLIPDAYSSAEEFVIAADTTVYFSKPAYIFQVSEPRGKQVFQALGTYDDLGLQSVFRQAKAAGPGEFRGAMATNPGAKLLQEMLFGNTRSGGQDTGEIIAASVIVEIP